jgi:polyhydroxyalkanoate synthase
VGGRDIDLSSIKQPLYVVAPEQDHICPWKSVYKVSSHVLCPVRVTVPNEGHITGVVNPPSEYSKKVSRIGNASPGLTPEQWSEASAEITGSWWPDWLKWLSERNGERKRAVSAGSKKYPPLDSSPGQYVLEK